MSGLEATAFNAPLVACIEPLHGGQHWLCTHCSTTSLL